MSRILRQWVPAVLAGWFGYLLVDFLVHAVVLASWWRETERYWLPPIDLLRRVPFGYASFALYCWALAWLLVRLYGTRLNVRRGARFGAAAGLVFGMASVLATYSAFAMPASALLVWPVSFVLGSTVAGAVTAFVFAAARPWRRAGLVFAAVVVLFFVGAVLQNLFFPTPADHLL